MLLLYFFAAFDIIQDVEMADIFRSSGKIYVVIGIIIIILAGIVYYLLRLEKKIKKLENDLKRQKTEP